MEPKSLDQLKDQRTGAKAPSIDKKKSGKETSYLGRSLEVIGTVMEFTGITGLLVSIFMVVTMMIGFWPTVAVSVIGGGLIKAGGIYRKSQVEGGQYSFLQALLPQPMAA